MKPSTGFKVFLIGASVLVCGASSKAQSTADSFYVTVAGGVVAPAQSGGSGFNDGTWYPYPDTGWWNQWFYDGPYRPVPKAIRVEFDVISMSIPFDVVVNWTLPEWVNPAEPPMADEEAFIGRSDPRWHITAPGHYEFRYVIPYCAQWVSVDVANVGDFVIENGVIVHECGIPAMSAWGAGVMTLLVLTAGTVLVKRRSCASAA